MWVGTVATVPIPLDKEARSGYTESPSQMESVPDQLATPDSVQSSQFVGAQLVGRPTSSVERGAALWRVGGGCRGAQTMAIRRIERGARAAAFASQHRVRAARHGSRRPPV